MILSRYNLNDRNLVLEYVPRGTVRSILRDFSAPLTCPNRVI